MRGSNARGVPFNPSSDIAHTTSAARVRISHSSNSRHPTASIACVPFSSEIPSFDCSVDGFDSRALQRFAARHARAFEFRFALAHQHQGHVRERREIAASAHAASRRNHRRHPRDSASRTDVRRSAGGFPKILWRAHLRAVTSWLVSPLGPMVRQRPPHGSGPHCAAVFPDRREGRAHRKEAQRPYSLRKPELRR